MHRGHSTRLAGACVLLGALGLASLGALALAEDKPENLPLKDQLRKIVDELDKSKKAADSVPDVTFPFGHFLLNKDDSTAPIVLQTAAPSSAAPAETPQVQVTVKGIVGAEGHYQVILNDGSYGEGDSVPNVGKITKITETAVTIQTNDGKTITKKAP